MTDIPVGSPPVPPGRHAAPGGWYPDPLDRGKERYWDGWQWSRTTRDVEGQVPGTGSGPGQFPQQYPGGYPSQASNGPGGPGAGGSHQGAPNQSGAQGPYGQQPYQQDPQRQPYQQDPYQQPYPQDQYPQDQYQQNPYQHPQQNPYQQNPYPQGPYGGPGQGGYGTSRSGKQWVTADGVPLAGWWWRVLAMTIDSFIVSVVVALLCFRIYGRALTRMSELFEASMRAAQSGQSAPMPTASSIMSASDQLLVTLATVLVGLVYHAAFLRRRGATPGKIICRLRVVPVDEGRNAGPLPLRTALVRAAIWVLPGAYGLLLLVRVLDALFPLWQPKRQALHDLAAHTQVVKLG